MKKIIILLILSISSFGADFTIQVNPSANSIDDSKVSSLSISKITNLQSSLDSKASQSTVDSALALKADQSSVSSALVLKADASSLGSLASKSTITNSEVANGALSSSKIANFASDVLSSISSTLSSYLQKTDIPICSTGTFLRKSDANTYVCEYPVADTNPAGTIIAFGGSSCPSNYLIADGSQVSRTTYANLFTAIGIAHGSGNGSTTFNLPDYRGRFLRGVDGSAGRDPDKTSRSASNPGGNAGNLVGSVQSHAFQSHGHSYSDPGHDHFVFGTGGGAGGAGIQGNTNGGVLGGNYTSKSNTLITINGPNSGNVSSESRPENASVHFCIKF